MNEIFNLQRFGRLFYKHTAEHYKSYLMSVIVLACVLLLGGSLLVFLLEVRMELSLQLVLLGWVVLFTGTIFTSTIFADLGNDKKALGLLTLPSSHFEKFLVAWLYSFAVFLVVSIGCFYVIMLFLLHAKHFTGPPTEIFSLFYNVLGFNSNVLLVILILYALFHSIAFFGAIYFKKLHFVKTALAFFIILAILIIFNNIAMAHMLHREIIQVVPFTSVGFMEKGKYFAVNAQNFVWTGQVVYIVMAIILWTAAYFRLKEKQV
jgi:magnesium-transporting ATPase (P-type)